MKTPRTIQKLVTLLANTSNKDYNRLLDDFDFSTIDFKPYQSWSNESYTRNCLYKDDRFELILLCWEYGQETPIHGHDGEDCWVYLLEGKMKEVFFNMDKNNILIADNTQTVEPDQVTFMSDNQGFHRLKNGHDGRSMSLHLYAKPIEHCQSFDEKTQQFVERALTFDTNSKHSDI